MNPIKLRRIYLKPREGTVVVDLETGQPVPVQGAWMLDNKYNRRRMTDGDLIETDPPAENGKKKKEQ